MRRAAWLALVIVLVGCAAGSVAVWISRERRMPATQPIASGALRGANVLLVTIDTLRADRVGAYGSPLGLTPTADRFAREGLRFDVTYAHVPLTLPSHTTIMTGTYPTTNGVHDNGSFRFDGKRPTLAGALEAAGYRTGAFVGAFVLDARFGLNTGFDLYDDRMHGSGSNLEVVQRTAEQVLGPAYEWISGDGPNDSTGIRRQSRGERWFAWVHLYDPHEPYAPPEPYRSRYVADPYAGEVAYTDAALGTFIERLQATGALDRTLVVLASDHGESLGEHGERTHGLFAYEATLRVPLIVWARSTIRPAVIPSPARLVDVMPTILDLVGVNLPGAAAPLDGRSLRPFISGERPFDDGGSYFEALNANLTRNWAPLRGIVRGRLKLIDLPIPELYDLSSDPDEVRNIYASQRERAKDLELRLDRVNSDRSAAPGRAAAAVVDAEAEARLRSLGYVVGAVAKPARAYTAADDPKRLVHLNAALDDAAAMWARGDDAGAAAAIDTLRAVVKERPDLTLAYDRLAFMLRATGRIGEAVNLLDQAAKAGHGDRTLMRSLGSMLRDAGDPARSALVLEALVHEDASDAQTLDALGQTYTRMNRAREAEAMFRRALAVSPNAATTWNNLGALFLGQNRVVDAKNALSRAIAINPELAAAHNGLGVAYAQQGDLARAAREWNEALKLRPDLADARDNLDRLDRSRARQ